MSLYANDCFSDPATVYCPDGVRIVQVGIIGTGILEILVGLLIMRIGKEALDKVLPPVITGSVAIVIGIALAGAALGDGQRQLDGRIHHPDRDDCLLGLPAGQRA